MTTSKFKITFIACIMFLLDSDAPADIRLEMISVTPSGPIIITILADALSLEPLFCIWLLWYCCPSCGFLQCVLLECRSLGESFLFIRAWTKLPLLWKNLSFNLYYAWVFSFLMLDLSTWYSYCLPLSFYY